jgi:hypothetical protein
MAPRTAEQRSVARQRKRFQVQFESGGIGGVGFTGNLSATGLQLHSKFTLAPGSILRGKLVISGGTQLEFQAEVRWVHRASGQLAQLFQSSMGLRFLVPPGESYLQQVLKPPAAG